MSASPDRLELVNEKFWTRCWDVFGFIKQVEQWTAVDGIHSIRGTFLLPLLAWVTETPEYGYRRLESKLDDERADRLDSTLVHRDPDALYSALRIEIERYDELLEGILTDHGIS